MNRNKLFLILCFFCLIATNVAVASAQVSGDWNIGPGWDNSPDIETPTPSPTALPTSLSVITNIFGTTLAGIGMFAVIPIISVAGLIVTITMMMRGGEEIDPKIIVAGIALVIVVNIMAVVGILVINGVNTAMPTTGFLSSFS